VFFIIGKPVSSKTNGHSMFSFKEMMAAEQMTTDEMSVGEMA
jgi:hypothetical protein